MNLTSGCGIKHDLWLADVERKGFASTLEINIFDLWNIKRNNRQNIWEKISKIEQSETVDDDTLEKMAKALGVSVEAIKNFSEQAIFNNINTFHDSSSLNDHSALFNYQCTFNPIDKWIESIEENKRLHEENKNLYEELLKSEREKVAMLQQLLEGKK